MLKPWQLQQAIVQMVGGGKASGKGQGYSNFEPWGGMKGGSKGLKGKGKGLQGKGAWEEPCGRCGGKHLTAQCPCLTNGKTCNKCGRTGHAPNCCRSKKIIDDETCKCCGELGHIKKECPRRQEHCGNCNKVGHVKDVCTGKVGPKTTKDTGPAPSTATGPQKLVWLCTCGMHHYQDSKICKCGQKRAVYPTPEEAAAMQTSQPKQYVTLKAMPIQLVGKWLNSNADGTAPTKEEEEQQATKHKLELAIEAMEAVGTPDMKEAIDTQKATLARLNKKIPATSAQSEKAIMHTGLAEIEDKYAAALEKLKAAGEKHYEQQQKEVKAEEKAKKDLEEAYAHNLEVWKKTWEAAKAATTKKIEENKQEMVQCEQQEEEAMAKSLQALGKIESTMVIEQIGSESKEKKSTPGGVTFVPTAPGHILHSNDVCPTQLHNEAMNALGPKGATTEMVGAVIEFLLTSMKKKATVVTATAETQQQQQQQQDASGVVLQSQLQQQQQHQGTQAAQAAADEATAAAAAAQQVELELQMENDLTDDTGDEADTAKANAKAGDVEVVKKIKKSEKKAKRAKK